MIDPNCSRPVMQYCFKTGPAESNPSLQAILTKLKSSQVHSRVQIQNSWSNFHAPAWWTITTHAPSNWLRRNLEYCAQRRTPMDFDVWNAPQIDFLSPIRYFLNSTKFLIFRENLKFHHHGPKFRAPITLSIKCFRSWYLHHPKLHASKVPANWFL